MVQISISLTVGNVIGGGIFISLISHYTRSFGCIVISSTTTDIYAGKLTNSSPPSVAYMRQWIRLVLVQIMACRLFGAKPLSKPMLFYCQLDPKEQTSVKF